MFVPAVPADAALIMEGVGWTSPPDDAVAEETLISGGILSGTALKDPDPALATTVGEAAVGVTFAKLAALAGLPATTAPVGVVAD